MGVTECHQAQLTLKKVTPVGLGDRSDRTYLLRVLLQLLLQLLLQVLLQVLLQLLAWFLLYLTVCVCVPARRVFTLSTGRMTRCLTHPTHAPVHLLALSREGDVVMYSSQDALLHLFDINAQLVKSVSGDEGGATRGISSMIVSSDGLLLFTGTVSGCVDVFRLCTLTFLARLAAPSPPPGRVESIALSPCNNFVACGFSNGDLCMHTNEVRMAAHLKKTLQELGIGQDGMGAL